MHAHFGNLLSREDRDSLRDYRTESWAELLDSAILHIIAGKNDSFELNLPIWEMHKNWNYILLAKEN